MGYVCRMTTYQTILFDLDGTLIDSVGLILDSYHHTTSQHDIPRRDDDYWLRGLGTPLNVQFAEWDGDPGKVDAMIATYREYNLRHHDDRVKPYPMIVEVVRRIVAAKVRLGLVTSKARGGAIKGLSLVGLEQAFEVLVCADDVSRPKPDPEPVHRALALLESDPATTVFVGDSLHDIHAGRAAGVATAAALWGPFNREVLDQAGPDHWLEQPIELLKLVAGSVRRP